MVSDQNQNKRKQVTGIVVTDKADKTIGVQVESRKLHPKYKKYVRTFTKFYAHDEANEAKKGDLVLIEHSRPLSRTKRWRLISVVRAANESIGI